MSYSRIFMIQYLLLQECEQNDRAPGMLYKCWKAYKEEIKFRTKNRVQSTKNTKRRKTSFLKEYVENKDLYRPVQNKTMTTQE